MKSESFQITGKQRRREENARLAIAVLVGAVILLMQSSSLSAEKDTLRDTRNKIKAAQADPLNSTSPNPTATNAVPGKISFFRDIRPLLANNCFQCHGPDDKSRKADLRLDLEEGMFSGRDDNKPAIIQRGDPENSELYQRLIARDPDDLMPPEKSHKVVTALQIDTIKKWIKQGGVWESHWAFIPPASNGLPKSKSPWSINEIDRFVLAALKKKGMRPSPEADRRTLIRRVTLDITGLPPTPEQVDRFLNDHSKNAYEKLIDGLLDSPRYGEHRARYWLDAARYADTHGLQRDNYRSIWPYRDWVIKAYNKNIPFDQFTIEQLAGDLLPSPTQDQLIATGYGRCNVTSGEDGSIEEELLNRYGVDRVSTTGTIWLGLTLGCVQCHDHKFDPLSQKEFYQLLAFFNNTTQKGHDNNSMKTRPTIQVYQSEAIKKQAEIIQQQIRDAKRELDRVDSKGTLELIRWIKNRKKVYEAAHSLHLPGELLENFVSMKNADQALNLGVLDSFSRFQPFSFSFRIDLPKEPGEAVVLSCTDPDNDHRGYRLLWKDQALRLELIEKWPDRILRRSTSRRFHEGTDSDVVITYDGSGTSAGINFYQDSEVTPSRYLRSWVDTMVGDFDIKAPLIIGKTNGKGDQGIKIEQLQVYDRNLNEKEAGLLNVFNDIKLESMLDSRNLGTADLKMLRKLYHLTHNEKYKLAFFRRSDLEAELSRVNSLAPSTMVMEEKPTPPFAHVLERGDYEKPLEKVGPNVPAVLHSMQKEAPQNRLGLAKWLVDSNNPLTARVTVNRFWSELFGAGLVKTANDFGIQGEMPSHPELLDWLALNFVESGWDVKAIYRKILMSATYRQSSKAETALRELDPENRLLARGPRFRMDAEMIRDQALAASNLLVNRIGGPGVNPYQPAGLWQTVGYSRSNTQTYSQDHGEAEFRRSLYTFIKRSSPAPNMSVFNAPSREYCVVTRERTNTPLQALTLMNDPQYIDTARHFALRVINERENLDDRLNYLSKVLFARPFSSDDFKVILESYHAFEKKYRKDESGARALVSTIPLPEDGKVTLGELAAWVILANQMLNLDETITKY